MNAQNDNAGLVSTTTRPRRGTPPRPGTRRPGAHLVLAASLFVSVTMMTTTGAGWGSAAPVTTSYPAAAPAGQWPYPNGDLANTREAPGSTISSANVSTLREAWAFALAGTAAAGVSYAGSLTAAPVVQDGAVYVQDQDADVYALALATGRLKWEYREGLPEASGPGPDGVAVADGTVYGDTSTSVFALSAATGKMTWVDHHLLNKSQGAFDIQPQVAAGRVYLASAYGRPRRRGTDSARCRQRPPAVEVQHGPRPGQGRGGPRRRLGRGLGNAAGGQ